MIKNFTIIASVCFLSCTILAKKTKEPFIPMPPTVCDLGYMFHDGTHMRPHMHINRVQVQETLPSTLPSDTVITAETDDLSPDRNKQSHIAIILYDPASKTWLVDYATIQPQSNKPLSTLHEAQAFALNFLQQPSAKNKCLANPEKLQKKALLRQESILQDADHRERNRKEQAANKGRKTQA